MSEPAIPAPGKCGIPGTRAWLASFFACGIVVLTAVVLWGDNVAANGKFVYGLDDAYIHLTISRTFSEHGVWGVCPQEWVSASSSPLWTLLLALWHRVSGTAEQAPLLLNMAVAILLILACDDFLRRFWPRYFRIPGMRAGFLSALVFVVPVPALLISGMEHLLHILLAVLYLGCAVGHLWPEDGGQPRGTGALIAVTMLGVAIRYETLFLVVSVVAVLAWRRQWRMAYALLVASLVPVVVFGVYFQWNGATFIPVSVLIKTFRADLAVRPIFQGIPGGRIVSQFLSCPSLFALTIAGVFVAFCARRSPEAVFRRLAGTSGLVAASSLLHVQFADTGWFFRYEAYLLTIGMLAIVPAVYECGSFLASIGGGRKYMIWYMTCAAGILVFCGIGSRAVRAAWETPLAYRNIGGQQYQIARFLADPSEDQRPVALNDVGAVGYLHRCPDDRSDGADEPGRAPCRIERKVRYRRYRSTDA